MWHFSKDSVLKFMSSSAYTRLSFDFECRPGINFHNLQHDGTQVQSTVHCDPYDEGLEGHDIGNLSPTDILINILKTGNMVGKDDARQGHDLPGLLSSVMMQGLPMLGLDDFVRLSDFVNENLGIAGRRQIMEFAGYRERFGNFLDVRKRELRIAPRDCVSEALSLIHI